jgi:hypothetical protein
LLSKIVERALDMRCEQPLGRAGIAVEPRLDELAVLEIGSRPVTIRSRTISNTCSESIRTTMFSLLPLDHVT